MYDDPTYKTLKNLYDGSDWANDIDNSLGSRYIFNNSLRYAENHDEVRLAAARHWGKIGMMVGLPVAGILYGLSPGPALLYNGQEVGEPGAGAEGFGGDDGRTSIFDYWSMPELAKWVNQHQYDGSLLSPSKGDSVLPINDCFTCYRNPLFAMANFFLLISLIAITLVMVGYLTNKPAVTGCIAFSGIIRQRGRGFLFW